MMANIGLEMVYFEIRLAVSLFKGEGAKLAFSVVHFTKQDANSCGCALMALDCARRHSRAWSAFRLLRNAH